MADMSGKARGFCTCKRDHPGNVLCHPPEGATWHYLCDKPVLAGAMAQFDAERERIEATHAARVPGPAIVPTGTGWPVK